MGRDKVKSEWTEDRLGRKEVKATNMENRNILQLKEEEKWSSNWRQKTKLVKVTL